MHDQGLGAAQIEQQVFAPPSDSRHPLTGQALCHALGQGPAQIGTILNGAGDHAPLQLRDQAAAHRLDLGQFRHVLPSLSRETCL